jgi:peptide/nickel transport system permease protein
MTAYIIRRLIFVPVILFGVTVLIFLMLVSISPAERASLYVRDIPRNPKQLEGIIKRYGLDQPLPVQYWYWLVGKQDPATGEYVGGILRGEFGYSRTSSQPVANLIARRFPATIELALYAVWPIIGLGVWMGIVSAVKQNTLADQILRVFSIIGSSFPTFVFGLLLLMFFYAQLRWFPPGRLSDWANAVVQSEAFQNYTSLVTVDALLNGRLDIFLDALRHLLLPVITLTYVNVATYLRVTRSSMLETLRQEYVTTARAKGLPESTVINRHARRNALIPVATLSGFTVAGLLGGVVFTETIFEFPGIGSAAGQAAAQLDVITTLSFTILGAVILVFANLIVDIMYAVIDPRVRLQ